MERKSEKTAQIIEFENKFEDILNNVNNDDFVKFENLCSEFVQYLAESIDTLPGPKHPARKYYLARKKGKENAHTSFSTTKNPKRLAQRQRENNKQKYQYDLAQYHYFNQRQKVVRNIMKNQSGVQCKIPTDDIFQYFNNAFNVENNLTPILLPDPVLSSEEDIKISEEEINIAISKIKITTAAGPDQSKN